MAVQADLQFKGYEINRVVFEKPVGFFEGQFSVNVQHVNHINNDNRYIFTAEFIVTVNSEDKSFNLQVQTLGHFEITGEVIESIYDNYLTISVPTIVYPYIRAFITNLVIQSGMKPIIIPPLNFGAKPESVEVSSTTLGQAE